MRSIEDTRIYDIPPLHMPMHSTIMSAHISRYMYGVLRGHHTFSVLRQPIYIQSSKYLAQGVQAKFWPTYCNGDAAQHHPCAGQDIIVVAFMSTKKLVWLDCDPGMHNYSPSSCSPFCSSF